MTTPSKFLQGPFAPAKEEITAFDLPVTGTLPAELNGRYLRNEDRPGKSGGCYVCEPPLSLPDANAL